MSIRISIADDHPMIIQGIRNVLANYPDIALQGTYANGEELLANIDSNIPDILLLDIQLPGKTGYELAPVLLRDHPDLKIIILTNFDSVLYVNKLIAYGVHGYLLKTTDGEILIEAIKKVYGGEQFIDDIIKEKIQQQETRTNRVVGAKPNLTTREKEVLQLIVNGYTDPEIAEKIFLSLHTVKHYRISILLKMDVKNTATLVKKALQLGLAE